ncbi:MAG: hypothetical protein SGPRY_001439 [Prymnesium sp.]
MTAGGFNDMYVYGINSPAAQTSPDTSYGEHKWQLVPFEATDWYHSSIFVFEGEFSVQVVLGLWALVVGGAESPENHAVYLAVMQNMDRVFPSSLFGSLLGQFDAINTDSSKIRQRIADLQHNLHVVRTTAPAVTPQSSFAFETNLQSRLQAVATERAHSGTTSFESPQRRNTKEDAAAPCRAKIAVHKGTELCGEEKAGLVSVGYHMAEYGFDDDVCNVPAPCVGTALSNRCQPTDKRIHCIVECAIGQNHPSLQHKHGKRKHGDDIHYCLEKYVSRRKAEIGANSNEDHTGAGDEEREHVRAAGRDKMDFNSPLSLPLDELIRLEQECLEKEEAAKASSERLGEELVNEAMVGVKRVSPTFAAFHKTSARSTGSYTDQLMPAAVHKLGRADPFVEMVSKAVANLEALLSAECKQAEAQRIEAEVKEQSDAAATRAEALAVRLLKAENQSRMNAALDAMMRHFPAK